jgi:hypothetical protein
MLTKATTKKKRKSENEDVEKAASVHPKKLHRLWNHQLKKLTLLQSRKEGIVLKKITFHDICESNQSSFRESGSARRQAYDIKQLNVKNYSKLLQDYSIVPGPYTFAFLKEAETRKKSHPSHQKRKRKPPRQSQKRKQKAPRINWRHSSLTSWIVSTTMRARTATTALASLILLLRPSEHSK